MTSIMSSASKVSELARTIQLSTITAVFQIPSEVLDLCLVAGEGATSTITRQAPDILDRARSHLNLSISPSTARRRIIRLDSNTAVLTTTNRSPTTAADQRTDSSRLSKDTVVSMVSQVVLDRTISSLRTGSRVVGMDKVDIRNKVATKEGHPMTRVVMADTKSMIEPDSL